MLKSFTAGITVGAIVTLIATQYHVIRTPERVLMISRVHQAPLRSAYVDVREWNPAMWEQFPELSEAVVKAGRRDLLVRDGSARQAIPVGNPHSQGQGLPYQGSQPTHPHATQPTPHPYSVVPTSAPSWTQPTAQGETPVRTARIEPLSLIHSTAANSSPKSEAVVAPNQGHVVPPVSASANASAQFAPVAVSPIMNHSSPVGPVPAPEVLQPEAVVPPPASVLENATSLESKAESQSGETRSWFGSILRSVIPRATESASTRFSEMTIASNTILEKLREAEQFGVTSSHAEAIAAVRESVQAIDGKSVSEPTPSPAMPVEQQIQTAAEEFPQSPRRVNGVH